MSAFLVALHGAAGLLRLAAAEMALASGVCLAVWGLCALLRGRFPAFQHALWALVLVRLLLPPSLAHPLSLGSALHLLWPAAGPLVGGDESGPERPVPAAVPATGGARRPAAPAVAVLAAWFIGSLALLAHDVRRSGRCRELRRRAAPVETPEIVDRLEAWRRRFGIRRRVRLLATDAAVSPFTTGVLRPLILVPACLLEERHRAALATALCHELAHVARLDALWLPLQRLVSRLYFFHPAVWLASARLHAGRERLADALAVSSGLLTPRDYARGLADALQLGLAGVGASGLFTNERSSTMRLRTILEAPARRPRSFMAFACAGLVGGFLLPSAAHTTHAAIPEASRPAALTLRSPLPCARVTWRFGKVARHPLTGVKVHHSGIDLAAPLDTPVLAPAAGIVETATGDYAASRAAGTVIVIDHGGGTKTFLAHLGTLLVTPGQHVGVGESLARVGLSGKTTGPHVHFEVWRDGERVDPGAFVPDLD